MDVGDGGQAEFGPAPGWRRLGGTNRMFFSFVLCVVSFSFVLAEEDRGAPDRIWFKGGKMVAAVREGSGIANKNYTQPGQKKGVIAECHSDLPK